MAQKTFWHDRIKVEGVNYLELLFKKDLYLVPAV